MVMPNFVSNTLSFIPFLVDCVWNDWTVGQCSLSCGGGTLTKIRTHNVTAQHGGEVCAGHAEVTESCNVQECPGKFLPL